jgi:hypothetical protein
MNQARPHILKSYRFATHIYQKWLDENMASTRPHTIKSARCATDIYQQIRIKARPNHALIYLKVISSLQTSINNGLTMYGPKKN